MGESLLLEIGVEELPSSFVAGAVSALPQLLRGRLDALRIAHGEVTACGTPRRLTVIAADVAEAQPDLDEEAMGPPVRVAFDSDGKPTKAAESFAKKLGCAVEDLGRKATPKGEYVVGRRVEKGSPALELLPAELEALCVEIPFRKSMRWSDGDVAFGRPVRWLVALLGSEVVDFSFAGVTSGRTTYGHRFLAPDAITVPEPSAYASVLREAHVLVHEEERTELMMRRLNEAAVDARGELIEDEFLVGENLSLVEEPHVVVGTFDESFLALPERVILDVAKDHQRYFGIRSSEGRLLPRYLAVVNTAEAPDKIRLGNDRVMRARLADAKFFYDEDLKQPLIERRADLDAVVFQKRLGSIGDKVRRIERLVLQLGSELGLSESTVKTATTGVALAKCDLVTLMVGELPELQGEMGRAYARQQGTAADVADVIAEHYQPRGADDPTAPGDAGALVAIADRLDTLAGCFAIGLAPTGAADPLALRRASIGVLRTVLDKRWNLSLASALAAAHGGYEGVSLDLDADETGSKLLGFFHQRLRGLLSEQLPGDVVDATLAASADPPHAARLRAEALGAIAPEVRAGAGEVFKRAANIAKESPAGEVAAPESVQDEVHASERALHDGFERLRQSLDAADGKEDYSLAFNAVADFAPTLAQFFDDVFVMVDDVPVRENRLRMMRAVHTTCSRLANFKLLAKQAG